MTGLSYKDSAGKWQPINQRWTRPSDWLPTNVAVGEQKVQMLVQIGVAGTPEPMRIQGLSASGAFTVDWGDGTAPQNFASSADALHLYDPASLAGTLTSDGYLQALITITPQAGQNLNTIFPSRVYYAGKNARSNVVEIVVGPATMTSLSMSSLGPSMGALKRVVFLSTYRPLSVTNHFLGCTGLREVIGVIESNASSCSSMFSGCTLLENMDALTLTFPNVTTAASMFLDCQSMTKPPVLSLPALVTASTMFQGCVRLTEAPAAGIPWTTLTTTTAMFQSCNSLVTVPSVINLAAATVCASMFQDCFKMQSLTVLTPLSTNNQNMFVRCAGLRELVLDTPNITSASTMFSGCVSLEKITGLDLSKVSSVNLGSTFANCYRLSKLSFNAGKGPAFTFTISNTNLAAPELNDVYSQLPTVTGQTITVSSVPGTLGDDPTIATAKGWTVTGS